MAFQLPQRLMPQQPDTSQFMQMLGGQQPPGLMGNVNPSAMQLAQFLMNDPGFSGQIPTMGTGMPFGLPMMTPGMQAGQPREPMSETATGSGQQQVASAPRTPTRRYFSER